MSWSSSIHDVQIQLIKLHYNMYRADQVKSDMVLCLEHKNIHQALVVYLLYLGMMIQSADYLYFVRISRSLVSVFVAICSVADDENWTRYGSLCNDFWDYDFHRVLNTNISSQKTTNEYANEDL